MAQLVAEADRRGKAEMVDEAMEWVKCHEPSSEPPAALGQPVQETS